MNILNELKKEVKRKIKNDPSHDFDHIMRVYKNVELISKSENVESETILYAALLHDIISYPKSDKRSKYSSTESAVEAKKILERYNFDSEKIKIITDAIKDHSFSRNKIPKTLEGKILQDADRLDAIGAIGIARVFAVGGLEKRSFYSNQDPFCSKRKPDDKIWTLDHFFQKLLKLEKMMNTKSGKIEAKRRTKILRTYLNELKKEICY